MSYSLILQYPYDRIEIALCNNGSIIAQETLHKFSAVSQTIPSMQTLLTKHNLTLETVQFFGVNVGPGPYNTLRALLTMVNAIHRVSSHPLIAANALDLMSLEQANSDHIIILQAFENNVFYKIQTQQINQQGACSIPELINLINDQPAQLHAYGNGAIKYANQLTSACPQKCLINTDGPSFNQLATLGKQTYTMYLHQRNQNSYLKPIYFEDLATQA